VLRALFVFVYAYEVIYKKSDEINFKKKLLLKLEQQSTASKAKQSNAPREAPPEVFRNQEGTLNANVFELGLSPRRIPARNGQVRQTELYCIIDSVTKRIQDSTRYIGLTPLNPNLKTKKTLCNK